MIHAQASMNQARINCLVAIAIALFAVAIGPGQFLLVAADSSSATASASATLGASAQGPYAAPSAPVIPVKIDRRLDELKKRIADLARVSPDLFNADDVRKFLNDEGSVAANRFIIQRSNNLRRAYNLVRSALRWRKEMGLNSLKASDFPCDLFKLGLIFEQGRAHHQNPDGQYVEANPVIWLRLGALGSIVKQLERLTPSRLMSYAYNAPREALNRARNAFRRRKTRKQGDFSQPLIKNMSVENHDTFSHVLKAIAWWLEDWIGRNGENAHATLVLDFENTDFAFASWSVGEFLVKLDDLFPNLFDQIIGFRYKPKLWSLHSPISMFNRIFKSRVASSPETDRKLRFVTTEPQMSAYMPRIDSQGYTMLPAHVAGLCVGPDDSKSPPGCQENVTGGNGLYDAAFWSAIHNEFYYACKAKVREQ